MNVRLSAAIVAALATPPTIAATKNVRVVWDANPDQNVMLGFAATGTAPFVTFGTSTDESLWKTAPVTRSVVFGGSLTSQFVKLGGLQPATAYYFRVCDSSGCGQAHWFKTQASAPADTTFIAGGDSRTNRSERQQGNRLVSKVRPAWVHFGGDLTDNNTAAQMQEWLDDWELSFASDLINGQPYKYVPALIVNVGNHEDNDLQFVCKVFGMDMDSSGSCSARDTYGAFNINGRQLRVYNLNSQFSATGADQTAQTSWLKGDLAAAGANADWRMGSYHRPALPRTSAKPAVNAHLFAWAQPFYDLKMNVVFESDSHMLKMTHPVKPAASGNDYVEVPAGTVYLGEGAWGAPKRAADRNAAWLADLVSLSHFNILQFKGSDLEIRTALFSAEAQTGSLSREERLADPLALPVGLGLRVGSNGQTVYTVSRDRDGRSVKVSDVNKAPVVSIAALGPLRLGANGAVTAQLKGDVKDDGKPVGKPLTQIWTGPAGASFANANSAITDVTFTSAGRYTLTLTASDTATTGSASVNVDVVANQLPKADFSVASNKLVTSFTDRSTDADGRVTTWLWDFGDGSSSTEQNPQKTYASAGSYNVTLSVKDNDGGQNKTAARTVTVGDNNLPIAAFECRNVDLSITCTDRSSDSDGRVVAWRWNVGEGSTAYTTQNIQHLYKAAGSYAVTLTVTDDKGGSTTSPATTIIVKAPNTPPVADFGCVASGLNVTCTDKSTDSDGKITAWTWDFGNGSSPKYGASVAHSFPQAGSYPVKLAVTDDQGAQASVSKTVVVTDSVDIVLQTSTQGGNKMDVKLGQIGAQSFKHGSSGTYTVSKIRLFLSRESTAPNADLWVDLSSAANGAPISGSRVNVTAASISNTSAGSNFQAVTLSLPTPVTLNAGQTYYLNVATSASNGKPYYLEYSSSGTAYANGSYFKNGSNDGKDLKFEVIGQ